MTRRHERSCSHLAKKQEEKKKEKKEESLEDKHVRNPFLLKDVNWRKEYTCVGLKKAFNAWLYRQHKIRAYFLKEANECSSEDTSCLRAFYKKVVAVHQKIRLHRSQYVEYINKCDSCQALKMRFMRWRARQTAKRRQLHLEIALCPEGDHECMQVQVDRIKSIQEEIARRLKEILQLHTDCVFSKNGTATDGKNKKPATRFSAAPGRVGPSTVLSALVVLVATVAAAMI